MVQIDYSTGTTDNPEGTIASASSRFSHPEPNPEEQNNSPEEVTTVWRQFNIGAMIRKIEDSEDLEDARKASRSSDPDEWHTLDELRKHLGR